MNKKKSKLIRLLPFMPIILTILVSFTYILNYKNEDILFSPPNFSPAIAANFTLFILAVFFISTIFMLIIFYYLTKKGYY